MFETGHTISKVPWVFWILLISLGVYYVLKSTSRFFCCLLKFFFSRSVRRYKSWDLLSCGALAFWRPKKSVYIYIHIYIYIDISIYIYTTELQTQFPRIIHQVAELQRRCEMLTGLLGCPACSATWVIVGILTNNKVFFYLRGLVNT